MERSLEQNQLLAIMAAIIRTTADGQVFDALEAVEEAQSVLKYAVTMPFVDPDKVG